MSKAKRLYTKLYYLWANAWVKKTLAPCPVAQPNKRNVFLYFDYEREFGGHTVQITNDNIYQLLQLLSGYGFNATWFTVGKIFEAYPESVQRIMEAGHEIASHTYGHTPPLHSSKQQLNSDFALFANATPWNLKIAGFHSPNGRWSVGLLRLLAAHGYLYHVAGSKGAATHSLIELPKGKQLVQFASLGDDWSLYRNKPNSHEVFTFFNGLLNRIPMGSIGGIGVHPWVLFSNPNILEGYTRFIGSLSANGDVTVRTAAEYAQSVLQNVAYD